ncbi:MAG: sigma-70 family RNA polymerase sigma factor [Bacteroidetes bacterium]|uniref:Sigma-70 family RNA polymerase sigma factor n=1 Tax=Phaeocystidibacter marisrubri TaxID=1577780 RepID=A0A6L3ZH39_9FLAO|nr:sigma-70 family RNA polymerase sigma factor [Phaeocystidibacter marisrubri]KAB2817231.1 sigma-70 family RNA polymerase sigma factor [Phaeocystidibacter marisrubri]TNE28346.1 MAG: sigma-70 family RNA polymerase sigma factor [Bacteroidota bacterium]GGH76326.1 RNA polymerase subunit sigma-24 [Phaeocystidibacter marisrubri]
MDMLQLDDSVLVKEYMNGREACLEVLINRHQSRVYSYIISKLRDEDLANDVFQDTFVKVINTLRAGRYNEEGKFLPWVMRIAHNLVIDHFRRAKRIPTVSPSDDFDIFDIIKDGTPTIENVMIREQIESDLTRLVEQLPDEQKEVLKLRIYSRLSFKEIAEQTDVSINTALGRMRYALMNLRKIIEQNGVSLTVD